MSTLLILPSVTNSDLDEARQQFVSVCQFRDLTEALVVKGMLESSRIECFLGDENTVRMDWFWSNAVGGVKLWVKESDAEAARYLTRSAAEKPELAEKPDVEKKKTSKLSTRQKYAFLFAITGFVVSLLVLSCSHYFYTRPKRKMPDELTAIFSIICPSSFADTLLESSDEIPAGTYWFSICLGTSILYGLLGFAVGNAIEKRQDTTHHTDA